MTVFLVGMMGSGKSTIGPMLAERLNFSYFDTDEILANMAGKSIADIFKDEGEKHFRQLEKELILNWKMNDCIVATGGGLPCFGDNIDLLNQKGITVYLKSSIEIITNRIKNDMSRPLIAGKSEAEIKSIIQSLLRQRKTYYEKAKIRLLANQSPDEIIVKLIPKLFTLKI